MRRARLKPISTKRAEKARNEQAARKAFLAKHRFCEAKSAGRPGECYGALSVHEVVPRARGGDTGDERIWKAVCMECNRRISQEPEMMGWAYLNGFLYHSYNDFLKER